jgi:hypothetical protein
MKTERNNCTWIASLPSRMRGFFPFDALRV